MASILDLLNGGFTPADAEGNVQQPMGGFNKAFADNSNAIIGLGLGMMSGTRENPFGNALQGFQAGAQADTTSAYRRALMQKAAEELKYKRERDAIDDKFRRDQLSQGLMTQNVKEYDYARRNGFTGSFSDWMRTAPDVKPTANIQEYE